MVTPKMIGPTVKSLMRDFHFGRPGRHHGLIASGAGGKPPQALWGRTVLYSRLHCSTSTAACANE